MGTIRHLRLWLGGRCRTVSSLGIAALSLLALEGTSRAEDSDDFRTYMHWRGYEWDTIWGVDDANGISLGANLSRHWGVELALDSFGQGLRNNRDQLVAEQTSISLIPQVRWRQPFLKDRLVPYVIAGVGTSFLQFNDRKSHGFGVDIEAEDWKLAFTGGVGIEYFISDEVAFGFEGKYMWIDELDTRIGTETGTLDMSSVLVSFGLRVYLSENHPRELVDAPSHPKTPRVYFGMRAGFRMILDGEIGNGIELTPSAQAYGHEMTKHYGFTLGYSLNRNWAIELAADGGESNIKVDGRDAIGEYAQVAIMPQIRYRYPMSHGRWVPYVSVAGGMMFAEFNDAKPQSVGYNIDAKGFNPVVRGGAGLEYFITRNFSLAAEALYQYSWDHKIDVGDRPEATGDTSTFLALLMFRVYLFDL